jgi:Leucine-rich repeat (LRR) protein
MVNYYCYRRFVKRGLAFFLLVLFASLPVMAGDVTINATTFPDSTFRSYVLSNFAGGDNTLTDAEAQAVTSIDISEYSGITDLTGISNFTNLEELICGKNAIATIDVSYNTALTRLELKDATITTLDLSNNKSLQRVNMQQRHFACISNS